MLPLLSLSRENGRIEQGFTWLKEWRRFGGGEGSGWGIGEHVKTKTEASDMGGYSQQLRDQLCKHYNQKIRQVTSFTKNAKSQKARGNNPWFQTVNITNHSETFLNNKKNLNNKQAMQKNRTHAWGWTYKQCMFSHKDCEKRLWAPHVHSGQGSCRVTSVTVEIETTQWMCRLKKPFLYYCLQFTKLMAIYSINFTSLFLLQLVADFVR